MAASETLTSSQSQSQQVMTAVLPVVDLGFEDLRDRMARFTIGFDEFIERGRKRLLEEKNEFARTMAEDKEEQRAYKAQLDMIKDRELQLQQQAEKEAQEAQEAERVIAEMKNKKQTKDEYRENLLAQIAETERAIQKRRTMRAEERRVLSAQASRNGPELEFWEEHLGLRMEGAGMADKMKFVFTLLLEKNYDKEFWCILDMHTREYEVLKTSPPLDRRELEAVVEKLNSSRDIIAFLKDMRSLFKKSVTS